MGVFALACAGLSAYIWGATIYHVYRPLASNVRTTAEGITPATILLVLQQAAWGAFAAVGGQDQAAHQSAAAPSRRPGRRRKHLTLAEAQREELRGALKVLMVWLACKGVEPAFDNTLGYVVPLYNALKASALLIFARFQCTLSSHLFDAFVAPLSQPPNSPLFNAAPFTALVFPAVRFLLSLPIVHLTTMLRSVLAPILGMFSRDDTGEDIAPASGHASTERIKGIDHGRVPAPRQGINRSREARIYSAQSSSSTTNRKGSRGGGDGGDSRGDGGFSAARLTQPLTHHRSMDSLGPRAKLSNTGSARTMSLSEREATLAASISRLESLPLTPALAPAPREIADPSNLGSSRQTSSTTNTNSHPQTQALTASMPSAYAYIPAVAPTIRTHEPEDFVPPPPPLRTSSPNSSSLLFSPRMPGKIPALSGAGDSSLRPQQSHSAQVGQNQEGSPGEEMASKTNGKHAREEMLTSTPSTTGVTAVADEQPAPKTRRKSAVPKRGKNASDSGVGKDEEDSVRQKQKGSVPKEKSDESGKKAQSSRSRGAQIRHAEEGGTSQSKEQSTASTEKAPKTKSRSRTAATRTQTSRRAAI